MINFKKTKIKNLEIGTFKEIKDFRGSFSRLFCAEIFKKKIKKINQINKSFSNKKYTLRGMHYQLSPFSEDKIVMCTRGKVFDVAVDLRKNSRTYGKWHSEILSEKNHKIFFIPKGFAHGFMTLEKNSEVLYFVSQFYNWEKECGTMYNDPILKIKWPAKPSSISKKDLSWKLMKKI